MQKKSNKKGYLVYVILTLAVFVLLGDSFVFSQSNSFPELEFQKANNLYKENKYEEAVNIYKQIINNGYESGNLYYNLANSYFKKGELGKAILSYERAKFFMPQDSDLRSNYEYARSLLNLDSKEFFRNRFMKTIYKLSSGISIDALTVLAALLWSAIFLVFILNIFFNAARRFLRPAIFLLVIFFVFSLISLKEKITLFDKGSVVVIKEAEFKFAPLESATVYFKLTEGNVLEVLESEIPWYKVRRSDGKVGWVKSESLELISK